MRKGGHRAPAPQSSLRAWLRSMGMCVLAAASGTSAAAEAETCDPAAARAVSIQGDVAVQRAGASEWQTTALGDRYCPGDRLRAGERSRADLALQNNSVLRVRAGTELVLEGSRDDSTWLDMVKGAAHFLSRQGEQSLEVETPFAVAGVRGTEFTVVVADDDTTVTVFEGRVLASNDQGELVLGRGQTAVAARGAAPTLRVVAQPRDAVRWTLYYPPVVHPGSDAFAGDAPWQAKARESVAHQAAGHLGEALTSLRGISDASVRDPDYFAYRASLLLAVGDVEAAEADLARALQLSPDHDGALAIETVAAIARNEVDAAAKLAERDVTANPGSATARIALSYVQQARFDLAGARASLEQAVALDPENALAWARLAEIHQSTGHFAAAREAAETAVALAPDLSRTQTVLGFAHLLEIRVDQAKAAFEKAIAADQGDPLPRLGLGLARIRDGELRSGGREIEIAASLDPEDSLTRSYLGKTYFEQKKTGLDERQYEMAKELDPHDPTPWFYSALAKQTTNRPVEALNDIQRAIELNDDRAVFRSRLLLDSDDASRSASLGRIYSDLGFQNLALLQGWAAVNQDPTNHSAHRLLADSLSARPRHEIARVSELYQSQLLQPLNTGPVQPALAESSLYLISTQATALGFNEFGGLFNRNQTNVQASGLGGSEATVAGEGIISGIYDRFSFSGGYSRYSTDGFRENNEQDDEVANFLGQLQLTPRTSLQGEYRMRNLQNGDLEVRFSESDFSSVLDEVTETEGGRVGLRHGISPNAVFLAAYQYQSKTLDFEDRVFDSPFAGALDTAIDREEEANTGEVQLLYRSDPLAWLGGAVEGINATLGAGHFSVDVDETISDTLTPPFPPPFPIPPDVRMTTPNVEHTNLYAYSYWSLPLGAMLTAGWSYDRFDEQQEANGSGGLGLETQQNWKSGVTWRLPWEPLDFVTLRGAYFRTLKRTLVTDQTLEPTQVAGFNQFYDDPSGTETKVGGAAIDMTLPRDLFAGGEFVYRDLRVPFNVTDILAPPGTDPIVVKRDWEEWLARAYLFWAPVEYLALSVEYQYEKFERDPSIPFAFSVLDSHRVPLTLQAFHGRSGLSALIRGTWVGQDGRFEDPDPFVPPMFRFFPDSKDFWVLDLAVRWRIPQRLGFVVLGVNNVTDGDGTTYQATDVRNPDIRPERFFYGQLTLAFP